MRECDEMQTWGPQAWTCDFENPNVLQYTAAQHTDLHFDLRSILRLQQSEQHYVALDLWLSP